MEINITINEYGEVYTSSDIIGYNGENNGRTLVFHHPEMYGCRYELWIDVGNESPYSVRIDDDRYEVSASLLSSGEVTLQWRAMQDVNLIAKSAKWTMKVGESISGDPVPIPTYEQSETLLQMLFTNVNSVTARADAGEFNGAKGDKGDKGERGLQGIQGSVGATGPKGDKGDKGDKGEQGLQGIQGPVGATGSKGDKGDKGDAGADGYTPMRGTDYWTSEDIAVIEDYIDGIIGSSNAKLENRLLGLAWNEGTVEDPFDV